LPLIWLYLIDKAPETFIEFETAEILSMNLDEYETICDGYLFLLTVKRDGSLCVMGSFRGSGRIVATLGVKLGAKSPFFPTVAPVPTITEVRLLAEAALAVSRMGAALEAGPFARTSLPERPVGVVFGAFTSTPSDELTDGLVKG
jgi:hypothetical protein